MVQKYRFGNGHGNGWETDFTANTNDFTVNVGWKKGDVECGQYGIRTRCFLWYFRLFWGWIVSSITHGLI